MSFGKIIALEGVDGCAKGTQSQKIKEYLESKGKKVKIFSFPQYETTIGKTIASYLTGKFGNIDNVSRELISIAYSADRASIQSEVGQLLYDGYYIIMNRYTYSNLFNAAKLPKDQWDSFINWIEDMEFNNLGVIKPDYNFYLYIDPNVSVNRTKERGIRDYQEGKEDIHENNLKLLQDTAECYFNFAKKNDNWFIINQMENNNQLPVDSVFEIIKEKIDYILDEHEKQGPLKYMGTFKAKVEYGGKLPLPSLE